MNIVTAYVQYCTRDGSTRAAALRALNAATGLRIRSNRFYEFEHGKNPIPTAAQRYMISIISPWAHDQVRAGEIDADRLRDTFSPPRRSTKP